MGQIYMSACGAPERTERHAEQIADVALAMLDSMKKLQFPDGVETDIRIGMQPPFMIILLGYCLNNEHFLHSAFSSCAHNNFN